MKNPGLAVFLVVLAAVLTACGENRADQEYEKTPNPRLDLLQGHILLSENKNAQALSLFDGLYREQPELINADDLRAYMFLLADDNRPADCVEILERYFVEGRYFSGLGLFASGAYEAAGRFDRAVYCAFLDYEYYGSYNGGDDSAFLANIRRLEDQLDSRAGTESARRALALVRNLYDPEASPAGGETQSPVMETPAGSPGSFFVEDYIRLKQKILGGDFSARDFNRLLRLEPYFNEFPVYYWQVWQAAGLAVPEARESFLPALERIILLDKSGPYAQPAWNEISRAAGFAAP